MTWMQFVLTFDAWWSTSTFCVAVFFITAYSLMAKWWTTPLGTTLVGLDAAVGITVFPEFLDHVFGISILNDRATGIVLILALTCVPFIILYRTWVLYKVQYSSLWKTVREKLDKKQSQNHNPQGPAADDDGSHESRDA